MRVIFTITLSNTSLERCLFSLNILCLTQIWDRYITDQLESRTSGENLPHRAREGNGQEPPSLQTEKEE